MRSSTRALAPLAILLVAVVLGLQVACAPSADASPCVVLPEEGPFPASVSAARADMEARLRRAERASVELDGWAMRTDRLDRARRDYRNGLLEDEPEPDALRGVSGTIRFPVLPIRFANRPNEPWNPVALETQLFVYDSLGTMTDYFDEVSYGNLHVTGDVWGWAVAAENDTYYEDGENGLLGETVELVIEAVQANDAFVDFGQYDNDGPDGIPNSGDDDGRVDVVFVMHNETGGECGNSNMWSHQWRLAWEDEPYETNDLDANGDPILIDRYCITPGLSCSDGTSMIEIGVLCHEFGHVLGIMDLYDTDDAVAGDSDGIGVWGLMGSGNQNSASSPAHMTAWTKNRLGWLTFLPLLQDDPNLCLPPVETNPVAVWMWSLGGVSAEGFVVENRQRIGFDRNLWNEGLVIYHIDNDVAGSTTGNDWNADERHKSIDVECADAFSAGHGTDADDLDRVGDMNRGDSTDVFCQEGGSTVFSPTTVPDSRSYSGAFTGVAVKNVGPCAGISGDLGDVVCARFEVGVPQPVDICVRDCENGFCNSIALCEEWWASPDIRIDHDGDGDDDYPAPGVENRVTVRVANVGTELATATTAQIWFAKGAMGLVWPDDAEQMVGVTGYPVLESGDSEWADLVFTYPEFPEGGGHYCIGAVIQQTYDPTFPLPANLSNNIAQVNHQVLMDRGSLGARAVSGGGCGSVHYETWIGLHDGANPDQNSILAEVRIGSPPNYDDAVIPPGWNVDFFPGQSPYFLSPAESDSVQVILWSDSATSGEMAHLPLTLYDLDHDEVIGGTVIDAHADCAAPAAVVTTSLEWLPPQGDHPAGPNVRLEWTPVELDVNGDPEMVAYYLVSRSKDGGPYANVGPVAVDADLGTPGFQWFDRLPSGDCPATWRYIVRAVDAAGAWGAASAPMQLECEDAAVDAPDVRLPLADALLPSSPNPMRRTSEIAFQLARAGHVTVAVYSARGEHVRTLWSGTTAAGSHRVAWDGRDGAGRRLASGVYFTRAELPSGVQTRKVVLVR